jgi:hypothetical protein
MDRAIGRIRDDDDIVSTRLASGVAEKYGATVRERIPSDLVGVPSKQVEHRDVGSIAVRGRIYLISFDNKMSRGGKLRNRLACPWTDVKRYRPTRLAKQFRK